MVVFHSVESTRATKAPSMRVVKRKQAQGGNKRAGEGRMMVEHKPEEHKVEERS